MNKTKFLEKHLGGKWKHWAFHGTWRCEDGRSVYKTTSLDEFDNPCGTQIWYCNGEQTRPFYFCEFHIKNSVNL